MERQHKLMWDWDLSNCAISNTRFDSEYLRNATR